MLVAYDKNQKIILADQSNQHGEFFCPSCKEPVTLRRGSIKIAHFAHRKNSKCSTFSEGETTEHLLGKKQLSKFFNQNNPILEFYFKSIKQRPDILLSNQHVIEFQCSPITNRRLSERLAGYERIGYQSIWILGRPYLKKKNGLKKIKQFLMYNHQLGFYLLYWDVDNQQMQIHHHFRFNGGKITYQIIIVQNQTELDQVIKRGLRNEKPRSLQLIKSTIIKQISKVQMDLIYGRFKNDPVQNLCYQYGYSLVGYPLELDYPYYEIPLLGPHLIRFKVISLILLKRYNTIEIDALIQMTNDLMQIDQQFLMLERNLVIRGMSHIYQTWQKLEMVKINGRMIKLIKNPQWYSTYHEKLNSIDLLMNLIKKD
ncbi:competence protein CoiA [Lactobacillus sp. Sy-1]|uniref:competence protein CoiA n=1 Tax=Lactobacillus sp. Sy-1 TaxID=2109645 RepID=UPI001C560102|nr:competence protein CoiA family protein [Lactobacillus sp. Sy-1]MBW1605399.1 hypothetical protein [Lactobacillus sp. Sy-1]